MKNIRLLIDFVYYCIKHPHERFWQALRNWSGADAIYYGYDKYDEFPTDTFYWERKDM